MVKNKRNRRSLNIILWFSIGAVAVVVSLVIVVQLHPGYTSGEESADMAMEEEAISLRGSTFMKELEERRSFEEKIKNLKTGYFKLQEFWDQPLNVKLRHLKYIARELHKKIPYIPPDVFFLNIAGIVLEYGARYDGKGYEEYREYLRRRYPGVLFKPAEKKLLLLTREASSAIFWNRPVELISKDVEEVVKAFVDAAEYIKGRKLTADETREIERRVYTYVLGAGFRNVGKESYRRLAESKGFGKITEFFYERLKSATESK